MKRLAVLLVAVVLAVGLIGSCSEAPLESVMGPSSVMVDSVAWKARMAHRPVGLMLSESMTDCNAGACTFVPANYHCGGTKVECSLQIQDIITTPTTMTPKTVVVSGSGALLCNNTMGRVVAYGTSDEVLDSFDLKPIDQSDCGEDNITFGGTTTFSIDAGVKYIIIESPSPLTFPVTGGGTGVMSAFYSVQINDEAIPFTVSCPATVVRADSVTCTATPAAGAAVTSWTWFADTGSFTYVRETNQTALTWAGQIVGGGHVEVSGTLNGHPFPVPAKSNQIAVTPRNWSSITSPVQISMVVPNTLSVTPRDVRGSLGRTLNRYLPNQVVPGFIQDGGPNNGYFYYNGAPGKVVSQISINASMDSLQPFFLRQYSDPGRKGSLPHGVKVWYCGRASVYPLRTIIRAHEGTQGEANSHVGFFSHGADSAMRIIAEGVGDPFGGNRVIERIDSLAYIADTLYDYSSQNNYQIDDSVHRQVLLPGNYKCRFQYWP